MESANVIYLYDGSFDGFLCCVFESFLKKEMPYNIYPYSSYQPTLYSVKNIVTDQMKSKRVCRAIPNRISKEALEVVKLGYLSCIPDKELLLLRFIKLGFQHGASITKMLQKNDVCDLLRAVQKLQHEAHLFTGFLRFTEINGVLTSTIEPKNFVLPLMVSHFAGRYPEEQFFIFDKTHRYALAYQPYEAKLLPVADFMPGSETSAEKMYQALWKRFFHTIAVEGRSNPKCQKNHLSIRYRANMTEFKDSDEAPGNPLVLTK